MRKRVNNAAGTMREEEEEGMNEGKEEDRGTLQ